MKTLKAMLVLTAFGIALQSVAINPQSDMTDTLTGLDPARYNDIPKYDKNGNVHIKGKINDYSPQSGTSAFNVNSWDRVTGRDVISIVNINDDGSFSGDAQLAYPQYAYLKGAINKTVFFIPGDTIEIETTTRTVKSKNGTRGSAEYFF